MSQNVPHGGGGGGGGGGAGQELSDSGSGQVELEVPSESDDSVWPMWHEEPVQEFCWFTPSWLIFCVALQTPEVSQFAYCSSVWFADGLDACWVESWPMS